MKQKVAVAKTTRNESIVTTLESLLDAAKEGQLKGLVGVAVLKDGDARYVVQGSAYTFPAVTLELLHRLTRKVTKLVIT